MKHIVLTCISTLFFGLLACSESATVHEKNSSYDPSQSNVEHSQQEQILPTYRPQFATWLQSTNPPPISHYDSDCDDCPASTAQILIRDHGSDEIKTCFGGLIKEDTVLTSRHCLPASMLEKGKSCEGSIRFAFSGNENFPTKLVECDEIIDFISEPQWSIQRKKQKKDEIPHPDWVLLKTKIKMPQRAAELHSEGVKDGDKLFAYFPSFDPTSQSVTIKKVNCESVQKSPFFPYFIEDKSPMVSVRCDEQLTNGSSGSNLYNVEGKIVGTLSHGLSYIRRGRKRFFKVVEGRRYSPWVAVNNLSCILDVKEESQCQFNPREKRKFLKRIFAEKIREASSQAETAFNQWVTTSELPFEWEKVNTRKLTDTPRSFQKVFAQRKKLKHLKKILNNEGSVALTKLFLPYYAKCSKLAHGKLVRIPYPYARVHIRRSSLRRVAIDVTFASTKGAILRKNPAQWNYLFLTGHEKPSYHQQRGDFFHPGHPPLPQVSLSLCN